MGTDLAKRDGSNAELMEQVIVGGDLSKLTANDRMRYYRAVCESVGLNPLTQPFAYLYFQNKMVLYARKECAEQLRDLRGVTITRLDEHWSPDGDLYTVTAYGSNKAGRTDADKGIVSIGALRGVERANAMMKATTKAKRRLTLSLCGLGMLDESEVEDLVARPIETVMESIPAPSTGEPSTLFATPEDDRVQLVQRARIAGARLNKKRVEEITEKHFAAPKIDYDKADLSALVGLVNDLEQERPA